MKVNAALAFVLAGASLSLLTRQANSISNIAGRVCGSVVALIGLLTLTEYVTGWNLGIDQWLIDDHTSEGPHPGRIPLAGAVNFLLLGTALLLLDAGSSEGRWLSQWLTLSIAFVSFVVILGYAYDVSSLYRTRSSAPVALHGAMLFTILSVGTLLARPDRGLMKRMAAADAGGFLIRRLLPAAVLVPPVIGWLRLQGEQAGLYGSDVGLPLYATANVVVLTGLIWSTATAVRISDAARVGAEAKLRAQMVRVDLLNHIARAIGERQDLQSVFQVVIRNLQDHLAIDFCCIALYEPADNVLIVEGVGGRDTALAAEFRMPAHDRLTVEDGGFTRCIQGVLVYERDVSQIAATFPQKLASAGLHALVMAPLLVEGKVFGVLTAARCEADSFTSADCEFLRQLSEHVALATQQAQLYGALQRAYDDLRNSQQAALQQERLRILGQMASGIAHDINNALSPMSLYTEALLERESNLSPDGQEQLKTIQRAIDDIAGTVARMREFYRHRESPSPLYPVDFNQVVQQVIDLTRPRWRDLPQERGIAIDVRTELAPSLPSVIGVEAEIRDALTNLIFNAVDAMPDGGSVTVRTKVVGDGRGELGESADASVSVEVSDTGVGMDDETRQRCLEPFFTTKGERGTGLGLAMVYGMVQRHGGELDIESKSGEGTTLRLLFPVTRQDSGAAPVPLPLAPTRPLRLLIVDDDPLLIRSLRHTLEIDKHVVTAVDGGQIGIDTFLAALRRGERFDLVITDLGMPYVDGRKVASAIRAAAPATPVVLLTGWGERLMATHDIPAGVDRVLAKPPKLQAIRRALAELTSPADAPVQYLNRTTPSATRE